jgi:choline kinase
MLAAGKGTRFNKTRVGENIPKCIIVLDQVNSRTILEMNIENIKHCKCIKYVDIVVGYKNRMIEQCIKNISTSSLRIAFKYNENYKDSVIISVKKGFEEVRGESVLLINGDTYFNKNIFMSACSMSLKGQSGITLFGSITNKYHNDDMLIDVSKGKIRNVGKCIDRYNGVSSGAILINEVELIRYSNVLKSSNQCTHHGILQEIIRQGGSVNFHDIGDKNWIEIDSELDLIKAKGTLLESTYVASAN